MTTKIGPGPGPGPEPTKVPDGNKPPAANLAVNRETIQYVVPSESSSPGCFDWLKNLFRSICAFFRELFSSSEQVPHREIAENEMKEEKTSNRTNQIDQEHVDAIRSAVRDQNFTEATSRFERMTDPLAQLKLIKELMKEDHVGKDCIDALVQLYKGKQVIFDRMKQLLETLDLATLTDDTIMTKEIYLQMGNVHLFRTFPKSTLAKIAVSQLIDEMSAQ